MSTIKTNSILTKTQADGAQTADLYVFDCAKLHQIQVVVSSTPAAGTLTVGVKTPGASTYAALPWTIDLTDLANNSLFQFTGFATSIQVTPTGFDADKTYSVYICTGDKGYI
jgi:hypothetical protein